MTPGEDRAFDADELVTRVGHLSCCGTMVVYRTPERLAATSLQCDDVIEDDGVWMFVSFAHPELGAVAWPLPEASP